MPDFGIFRGFNEKLFGDKLYAGQLPTQLGLIGSEVFGVDPDAQAFFNRVTDAGGTLSTTEQLAINTLVIQMKLDGIWTKMKAIYPMVGSSAAACAQNLKSSSFAGSFTSGWTFSSTGVTPSSAYMDTGLMPNVTLNQNSTHLSIYINNNSTGEIAEMGALQSDTQIGLAPNYGSLGDVSRIYTQAYAGNVAQNETDGYFIGSRIISNEFKVYRNAVNYRTTSSTSVSPPTNSIYIGAWNDNGNPILRSTRKYAFASIGDGLTDDEAGYLYTAVQAFQTTLSREV